MQEREPYATVAHPPLDRSGWGPWTHEIAEPAPLHGPLAELIEVGGALSVALWACATLLALQYF